MLVFSHSKVNQLHAYIYSPTVTAERGELRVLYKRLASVIYFIRRSVYMSTPASQFTSSFPPRGADTCPLHLCLYLCFADRLICTIFLDSTQMHQYDICFPLSVLLHSVCGLVAKLCPTLVTHGL